MIHSLTRALTLTTLLFAAPVWASPDDAPAGDDAPATRHYTLTDPQELKDFKTQGFDLVDMHREPALTLGAGSRNAGFMQHQAELEGDFTVELEVRVTHNTPSASLALVFNKKVGVLWGQQLVKPTSLRPYDRRAPAADQTIFREERVVTFKVERRGDTLRVYCNRELITQREFKARELKDMKFGLLARNIRFVVSSLSITG